MSLCRRIAALGGVVVALVAVNPSYGAAQAGLLEVRSLSFTGNALVPADSLRRAIVNRETECRIFTAFCWLGIDALEDRSYLRQRELVLDVARIQRYYAVRGYREARVDTTVVRGPGRVTVVFHVDEGRPVVVEAMDLFLTEPLADSTAFRTLPLGVGDPLSAIRLEAVRDTIEARLRNTGYAYADVLLSHRIPRQEPYSARVTLDVDPGPESRFGAITVVGHAILDEESVRRMLPFSEGSVYRRDQVPEGQRNLFSLDILQGASIEELRDDVMRDTVIPLTVRISEGDLHRVRAGLGWNTSECMSAEARWASRNFYGRARRLEARVRLSNVLAPQLNANACPQAGSGVFARLNGQVALELFQPWLFSVRNSFSASAFVERQSLSDVFVREALGLNLAVNRSIGRRSTLTLSYRPQLARLEAAEIFFCATFLACLPDDIGVFQGANWLAPIGLSAVQDRRNSLLNPSRGHLLVLDLEHSARYTGSNFEYSRVVGAAAAYRPVGSWVAGVRLRAGLVGKGRLRGLSGQATGGLVHPQKRFYAGGSNSVRGFAENRLGPRVLTTDVVDVLSVIPSGEPGEEPGEPSCAPVEVFDLSCDPSELPDGSFASRPVGGNVALEGNVELRFPLVSSAFQGVAFLDFGQVWLEREHFELGDIEFTPGMGMRYFSPIGPIRVDLGYRFRGAERLPVAMSSIRPFDAAGGDALDDRVRVRTTAGTETIDWVRTDQLAFYSRMTAFGADRSFFSRLQLHISIGQAF